MDPRDVDPAVSDLEGSVIQDMMFKAQYNHKTSRLI